MRSDTVSTRGSQALALLTTLLLCASALAAGNPGNTLHNASHASHSMGTSPATLHQFASQPQPTCTSLKDPESTRDRLGGKATTSPQSSQSLQPTGGVDPIALINSVISSTTAKNQPTISHSSLHTAAPTSTSTQTEAGHETDDAFSDASFLSFEDWKKQILEKDKNAATKDEKQRRLHERQETLDSLGDDHEIDIDFGALFGDKKDQRKQQHKKDEMKATKKQSRDQQNEVAKAEAHKYRSKDAGKTCKERTNFASFDSGAQIMKTNKEAQSASQILSENKDRYMLNTCSAKNKFLIVELSDSILVDTVALANFEFFSSTFRQFRLSVSDQYPVKLEKWVDLGTFEAKNTREIQAFRVEDPRIWARYLRIEFLSQYGSEFYCPVSLLRVHGRTMIQDILSQEQGLIPEDEEEVEQEKTPLKEEAGETMVPEAVADIVEEEERVTEGLKEAQAALADLVKTAENITGEHSKTLIEPGRIEEVKHLLEDAFMKLLSSPWSRTRDLENLFNEVKHLNQCYPWEHELDNLTFQSLSNTTEPPENKTADLPITPTEHVVLPDATISPTPTRDASKPTIGQNVTSSATPTITPSPAIDSLLESLISGSEHTSSPTSLSLSSSSSSSSSSSPIVLSASSVVSSVAAVVKNATSIIIPAAQNATSAVSTNRTSSSSSYSAQPTTQESFFKNVSKRLANLELDSSLSLKYIEEQSRSLREAFNKAEKRQAQKVTAFLENLNGTVIPQMKGYQQMYETIWKSTVTELEGQRDLLKGETEAMSERLKLLADELVFQKRMAIGQSVLLLLCLGLVLFGRYLPGGTEVWSHHAEDVRRPHDHGVDGMQFDVDSGLSSPEQIRSPAASPGPRRPWNGKNLPARPAGRRTHSNMSQRSHSEVEGPPTPFSDYSEVEPPSPCQAYLEAENTGNLNDSSEPRQPFDNSEVIESPGRRRPGDDLPPKRQVDEILQNMPTENSDPSIIRKQLEEAVNKELLPAFSATLHYSQSQRQPAMRSHSGGSPQMVNGTGRTQHPNQLMNSLENSWTEAGTSPEQSRRQSRRLPQSAQGGYVSDSGRSAGFIGPQIRVTPETPRGQRRSGSMPDSGTQTAGSGGSAQGSPEQPRRFSIARKPLPALPPREGNKF